MSYVSEITDRLLARCPKLTMLEAMDYVMIAEWEKQEIPLEIVFRSIDTVCAGRDENPSEAVSTARLQIAVKKNFRDWLRTTPENSIENRADCGSRNFLWTD